MAEGHGGGIVQRDIPRPGAGSVPFLPPAASFLSAAKEKRKRNAAKNYVFGFPYAPSLAAYPVCFYLTNAVPCKLLLNVASSLLLFPLPLLL